MPLSMFFPAFMAGGVMVFVMGTDRLMDDPFSVAGGVEKALRRYAADW